MSSTPAFTNRLIHESSPYLRQHAHNPVDWYPWGEEALERARRLDRPIFLSIGYSACHWCHVMEHESFEDPVIGQFLNENFVSIKVDREERPDLDQIYMTAVQMMTGQGGWPMSMFLTPDRKPFWGGTYFPPDDRYGRPGFRRVLFAIADAWQNRRKELLEQADDLTTQLHGALRLEPAAGDLGVELLRPVTSYLARAFDPVHGGFGSAPKFPHPMDLRLLLRLHLRFGDEEALSMVRLTLDRMAMGGIYDQLGGGFHRYSTDARWLVPHFEKMLYDNALLASTYVEAYQATGEPAYREVVEETLAYVLREMTTPDGGFMSTQDADSEGEEGKFFVWSEAEIEDVLGKETAEIFNYVYGVTTEGNWEEKNILHRTKSFDQNARLLGIAESELRRVLAEARRKLFDVRCQRVWPGRDDKVLTSWNGLMIAAFADASRALDVPSYAKAAARAADFVLRALRAPDGRLLRTWSPGSSAKLNAYLEDYSYLIDGLVRLYEATAEPRWVEEAMSLSRVMIEQCWDEAEGGFYYTGRDHEALIARTKDPHDNATPSGNAMAVTGLLRLAKLTGDTDLQEKAERTLRLFRGLMEQSPMAGGQMLIALDFFLGPVDEVAVVGDPSTEETRRVLGLLGRRFRPHQVVATRPTAGDTSRAEAVVPLLAGKTAHGTVTTYICRNFTCQAPLVGENALERALGEP